MHKPLTTANRDVDNLSLLQTQSGPIGGSDPRRQGGIDVAKTEEQADRIAQTDAFVHLGDDWKVWRWLGLRSAGFPFSACVLPTSEESPCPDSSIARSRSISVAHLRLASSDPAFVSALAWHNRSVAAYALPSVQLAGADTSRRRKRERVVAAYLQRFAAKNDTVGFFGPAAWARVQDDRTRLAVTPHRPTFASHRAFVEPWVVTVLAEATFGTPTTRSSLCPRIAPHIGLEGTHLLMPFGQRRELSGFEAELLEMCDGSTTAAEIASLLAERPGVSLSTSEILSALEGLRIAGFLVWKLPTDLRSSAMNTFLSHVGEIDLNSEQMTWVSLAESIVSGIEAAASGSFGIATIEALGDVERAFRDGTGVSESRREGVLYAGRRMYFLESKRAVEVAVGISLISELAAPLRLVLRTAAWLLDRLASVVEAELERSFAEISMNGQSVDMPTFWLKNASLFFDPNPHLVKPVLDDFNKRWRGVIGATEDATELTLDSSVVGASFAAAFPSVQERWSWQRRVCPDILVGGSSVEAINAGTYEAVLGEIHLAVNTLDVEPFVAIQPDRDELARAFDATLPTHRVIIRAGYPGIAGRVRAVYERPEDHNILTSPGSPEYGPSQKVPVSQFRVERDKDGLHLTDVSSGLRRPLMEALGDPLAMSFASLFEIDLGLDKVPRISIDNLVIHRASWRFALKDYASVVDRDPRHAQKLRDWAREMQIPQFSFVQIPGQAKPIMLDLDNPLSVEVCAGLMKRVTTNSPTRGVVTFQEMLPGRDDLWLADVNGQAYTSEFRLLAVRERHYE